MIDKERVRSVVQRVVAHYLEILPENVINSTKIPGYLAQMVGMEIGNQLDIVFLLTDGHTITVKEVIEVILTPLPSYLDSEPVDAQPC